MGTFRIEVELAKPSDSPEFRGIGSLIVDSESENTWVHRSMLEELDIQVAKPAQPFVMANGERITRDVGFALVRAQGFLTIDEVVFAKDGDLELLGARTLKGFNARVDAVQQRLVAAGPIIVASS